MSFAAAPAGSHRPLALVNARLVDPLRGTQAPGGVLVADGVIRDLGPRVVPANLSDEAQIIDCHGDVVAPAQFVGGRDDLPIDLAGHRVRRGARQQQHGQPGILRAVADHHVDELAHLSVHKGHSMPPDLRAWW